MFGLGAPLPCHTQVKKCELWNLESLIDLKFKVACWVSWNIVTKDEYQWDILSKGVEVIVVWWFNPIYLIALMVLMNQVTENWKKVIFWSMKNAKKMLTFDFYLSPIPSGVYLPIPNAYNMHNNITEHEYTTYNPLYTHIVTIPTPKKLKKMVPREHFLSFLHEKFNFFMQICFQMHMICLVVLSYVKEWCTIDYILIFSNKIHQERSKNAIFWLSPILLKAVLAPYGSTQTKVRINYNVYRARSGPKVVTVRI